VDTGELGISAAAQDRERLERLIWVCIRLLDTSGHNSASLSNMGLGLHCNGQISRFIVGPPSRRKYQTGSALA